MRGRGAAAIKLTVLGGLVAAAVPLTAGLLGPATAAGAYGTTTKCPGSGKVVAINTTCKKARKVAKDYPKVCAHVKYCDKAGLGTCVHLSALRIQCVGGTSSDPARPVVRFTTAHKIP